MNGLQGILEARVQLSRQLEKMSKLYLHNPKNWRD
jgi:hypothetical protein